MIRFQSLPFIVVLMGLAAFSMLLPAVYALVTDDHATSRAFLYSAVLIGIIFAMVALATNNMRIRRRGRSQLISILACLTVLPLMLALPIAEAVPDTRLHNAYFEMVSSLTTTGMTVFAPERLPDGVHLWRAQVAWMGGFFFWVVAIAVLAPLTLGGFELSAPGEIGQGARHAEAFVDPSERLRKFAMQLLPVYFGLTGALWLALFITGDRPLVALCHAMSVMSTSGITPTTGLEDNGSGHTGEVIIFLFFAFALSRVTFIVSERNGGWMSIAYDPEFRTGIGLCLCLAALLFLRHWAVSFEDAEVTVYEALLAFWGSLFTIASFLTTTGFESQSWDAARAWSGFGSPGVLLLGLSVLGGGVATTAGGVKLLRCYALAKHGIREMEKLVQPSSVGSPGRLGRAFRRQGAYAAWVFVMLFALTLALVMAALSFAGNLNFEEAMILSVASLSTTGPLVGAAGSAEIELTALNDSSRYILAGAMVIGRLETIAIIALLNPDFWR